MKPYEGMSILNLPKYTWQYRFGDLTVHCTKAPNRFHRFMQRMCFGIQWTKL